MKKTRRDFLRIMGLSTLVFCLPACKKEVEEEVKPERPNIVLIMADDMGFSDLGCYGSEIATPNINNLARRGIRFSSFYNAARCCPTRASLLTGLYPHQAGMGAMVTNDPAKTEPGPYQGFLNNNCVTLAEVLKSAGYNTFMSGKWHVGEEHPYWPMDRGFDDYYGLISGGANYFDITKTKASGVKRHFAKGNEEYMPPNEDWYITDAFSDNAVRMLDKYGKSEKPFFLYLSYTAPHWPLHAWPEDIEKYRAKYNKGWDLHRIERYIRQHQLYLFKKEVRISPKDPIITDWDKLSEEKKEEMKLKMAIYAAQVDRMDQGIGKVIDKIKELNKLEDTLIMFLSDNGGSAEGGVYGKDFWQNDVPPGGKDSYQSYGMGWANYSNTPFRKYKKYTHEGGISTPFIASWPALMKDKGIISHQTAHIMDIMATCCQISGAKYPNSYKGNKIIPMEGKSLKPIFESKIREPHEILCWEHMGSVAIRKGNWKLVAERNEKWELYDLEDDRTELVNLIDKNPNKAEELHDDWMDWAERCGVKISQIHKEISD